jgi:hypothetical protein
MTFDVPETWLLVLRASLLLAAFGAFAWPPNQARS